MEAKLDIEVDNCNLKELTISFLIALRLLFESFVKQALMHYYYGSLSSGTLSKQLQTKKIVQKSHNTLTKIKTIFGDIWIPKIQVRI